MTQLQLPLFPRVAADQDDMGCVYTAPVRSVRALVERYHYSGSVPTGKNQCFAWSTDRYPFGPYAAAIYGIGINPYQAGYLARVTGIAVEPSGLVTLRRVARVEPRDDDLPLTHFLARCHRLLRGVGIRWVVSFSDPDQGHTGTLYRAANFVHLGQTGAEWHTVDSAGQSVHRRRAYRARQPGESTAQAREHLGLRRVKTSPRDRWFLPLHRADRRQLMRVLA